MIGLHLSFREEVKFEQLSIGIAERKEDRVWTLQRERNHSILWSLYCGGCGTRSCKSRAVCNIP